VIASGAATSAKELTPPKCFDGRRPALVQGRFSGPLICSKRNATFRLVGHITRQKLTVYDYRYRFLPAHGNVMHGDQRMLVFRGSTYIGQYALATPPYTAVTVNGRTVVLRTPGEAKAILDFSGAPPKEILVNGEVEAFFR
jgi:hypothetical protein